MDLQTPKNHTQLSNATHSVKRNLHFSFHESTPVLPSKSRKRKSLTQNVLSQPTTKSSTLDKKCQHSEQKLKEVNLVQDSNSKTHRILNTNRKSRSSMQLDRPSQNITQKFNVVINNTEKIFLNEREIGNNLEKPHIAMHTQQPSHFSNLKVFNSPNVQYYVSDINEPKLSQNTCKNNLKYNNFQENNYNLELIGKERENSNQDDSFNSFLKNNKQHFSSSELSNLAQSNIEEQKNDYHYCNSSEILSQNIDRRYTDMTNSSKNKYIIGHDVRLFANNPDSMSNNDIFTNLNNGQIDNSELFRSPQIGDTSSYYSCVSDSVNNTNTFSQNESQDELKSCSSQNQSLNYDFLFNLDKIMVSSPTYQTQEDSKLSTSLEKCSLVDFDFSAKRFKWDCETPSGKRKSNSAPSTPQYSGCDSENYIKKYPSLDFTPKKSSPSYKIGTPESKKILYPQLIERKPASKPKSPQKLRAELKRLNKPAKKRLFTSHDFVYLFTKNSNNREIVHKIFSYLNDNDLTNIVKVSKLWKMILREDKDLHLRYKQHSTHLIRSKENLHQNLKPVGTKSLLTGEKENISVTNFSRSPARSNWHKYTKLASKLARNQQLVKCPMCCDPSVLEYNIAQCTKQSCQYIWCTGCLSGSKQGPEYFICKCEKGTTPPRTEKSLGDISNIESPRNCSFLTSDGYFNVSNSSTYANSSMTNSNNMHNSFNNASNFYYNPSYSNNSSDNLNSTSGYFSQSDIDKSNLSGSKLTKSVLSVSNRLETSVNEQKNIQNIPEKCTVSFHSIAEMCMKKKLHKKSNFEPTSPPKVKMAIVGSEKSKKSLRRLCL